MHRFGPLSIIWILTSIPWTLALPDQASCQTPANEWSSWQRERLASELESASKNLDPAKFPQLADSSAAASSSMLAAESFFVRRTDPANAAAWLKYLNLDPLRAAIQSDESPATVAREAIDLRQRLIGTIPGLELSSLQKLRHDLERLIESVRFRDAERAEQLVAKQMVAIAQKIREMDGNPSADEVSDLNAVIGLLSSSGQAPGVVRAFRDQFSRPNLAIIVRESMVQSAVNRGVNQSRPVRECILGTRIVGNASLAGMVTADLLPSLGEVRLQVALTANIASQNTGYNGPVRLQTVGNGSVNVTRTLHIRESGIIADPAHVQASLNTRITSIDHKLRLVRRIASKKAAEQKPNADRIALAKLRSQVGGQFTEQTNDATSIAMPDLMGSVRPVLTRLSLDEPSRFLGSTDAEIIVDSTLRRHDQLSAVVARPPVMAPVDAAVQIHESLIDNAMTPFLAGRTLREGDFEQLISQTGIPVNQSESGNSIVSRSVDNSGDDEAEDEPFEIEFARLRPIIFEARDQTLRVGVRGLRFAQGKRELKQAMEITALYRPATADDGRALLLREGDVDVSFPGPGKRLSVTQAGLKRTIQKKFADVFPAILLDRSFTVPADAKLESLRGRTFRPEFVDSQSGWLTIGVDTL